MSVYDFIYILLNDNYTYLKSEDYKKFNEFCKYFELGKVYKDDFKWNTSIYDEYLNKIDFTSIITNKYTVCTLDDKKSFIKQLIYFFKFLNKFKFYNWTNMDINDAKYIMETKLSNIKYELINMDSEDNQGRILLYKANNVVFYYKNNKIKWFMWGA